uniref:COBRA C-terminal domain-containing protein n=1 Tax=Chenopodium quinoa TaxID=63459 RepID=A0A803MWM9_CHEQI
MQGAEAKEQGVCNKSLGTPPPHCCLRRPVIIDLQPGAKLNKQATNCCRGGVLTSMTQDPTKYSAHFQMIVGLASSEDLNPKMPNNFKFGTPGYTCGDPELVVPSTRFPEDGGRRWRQALSKYSCFFIRKGQTPLILPKSQDPDYVPPPQVNCTSHMCPIHVHWHIKESYKEYWRVKITIINLNVRKNYTTWNLAVEHPNLHDLVQVFSFNYVPLTQDRPTNDTGLFWGVQYYNDVLLQSGLSGNVQTEMLLRKVPGTFTFDAGWAFPKRIYFNGENCVMPPPSDFPRLPKESQHVRQ